MKTALKVALPILVLLVGVAGAFLLLHFRREAKPQAIEPVPPLVRVLAAKSTRH